MIRNATVEDFPQLLILGKEFFDSTIYKDMCKFSAESATKTLHHLVDDKDGILVVSEDVNGVIRGGAGALLYPMYMTGDLGGQELFWWVNKKGEGIGLLDEIEKQAKQKGAKTFTMVSMDNLTPEKLDGIYLSKGYKRSEHFYVKRF